jgi:predicted glycosyltransferase
LYIGDFEPDTAILTKVGIGMRPETLAVVRTPPSRAVYHPAENPLFIDALRTICARPSVVCVVLTRHEEQVSEIASLGLPNCIVPRSAIDARSLIYEADVMVGAGGTMTREAALMGIPTWTVYAGRPPAVDTWLERQGRLSRLTHAEQLARLTRRTAEPITPGKLRERAGAIERVLVGATVEAGTRA